MKKMTTRETRGAIGLTAVTAAIVAWAILTAPGHDPVTVAPDTGASVPKTEINQKSAAGDTCARADTTKTKRRKKSKPKHNPHPIPRSPLDEII